MTDVLVVGGGVIGSSLAYHLTARPNPPSVLVLERDPSYAGASSSLSTAGIRQQFATPANIALSAFGIDFLRRAPELLEVDGDRPAIGLREPGYLILGAPESVPGFLERNATQRECGAAVDLLDRDALARRYPYLNLDGIAIGSHCGDGEGWFDGPALHAALRRKARAQGAVYRTATVASLDRTGSRITGVTLEDGTTISAETVVLSAGAWSGALARSAGLDLPIVPLKRCIFVFDSPLKIPDAPFIFDPNTTLVRPEGAYYICGVDPGTENDPDDFGMEVDHALFDEVIWPTLAHRIPGFEQLRLLRAWAGLYEFNTFDQNPVLGRYPGIENLVVATGFSGHGMMHSPAAGRGLADLILGQDSPVDLSEFAYSRIPENRPIKEHVY